jgi:HD-like signal output (HDOD) protein
MESMQSAAPAVGSRLADIETKMRIEVREIGIPPRPGILDAIGRIMSSNDPDFHLLASEIGSDVALAASVIKVANSPYFGFGHRVRSVGEALLVLGLRTIVRTIAGLELKRSFTHVPNLEWFWEASARSARVSACLARHLPSGHRVRPEDAYTFGLFRDCGMAVLMPPFPEYRTVLHSAMVDPVRVFTDYEDEAFFLNHAIVGAELAEDWLLPAEIHLAIRHHHQAGILGPAGDAVLPEASRRLIAIAALGEHLIHGHGCGEANHEWGKLSEDALDLLELEASDLDALHADCAGAVAGDLD